MKAYDYEKRVLGLTDEQIAECEARRKRAGKRMEEYLAEFDAEFGQLDADLGPLPPEPEYVPAKTAYTIEPTSEQGEAMALDAGFNPHTLGMRIAIPDEADRKRIKKEWEAAAKARSDEYTRRRKIVIQRLADRGVTCPKLTDAHSLEYFSRELREGVDSTVK